MPDPRAVVETILRLPPDTTVQSLTSDERRKKRMQGDLSLQPWENLIEPLDITGKGGLLRPFTSIARILGDRVQAPKITVRQILEHDLSNIVLPTRGHNPTDLAYLKAIQIAFNEETDS